MSASRKRRRAGTPALDLIEEAVALLRRAPAAAHLAYYLGAIPFWLGLLYYLADMSRDAYAASHAADGALIVALLYVWKKTWQTVSAAKLRAVLAGTPDTPWTARRVLRTITTQAAIQPWGLLVRPIAAVLTVPFVWVSAFYQNATIIGDGASSESVTARATAQAKLWPGQAHAAVSMIFVFTIFVWLNFALALGAAPFLVKTLLGIETIYSRSGMAFFNTTFFATTIALTSLAVDPLRKAVFVLRCFRGVARTSGEDLVAELRQSRRMAAFALAAMLLCANSIARADSTVETRPSPTELDHRITEVLERREYSWRAPRETESAAKQKPGWFESWLDQAAKTIGKFASTITRKVGRAIRWVRDLFSPSRPPKPGGSQVDWAGVSKAVLVVLGIALAAVLAWLLVRTLREQKKRVLATAASPIVPDLSSDDVVADLLPEDGWLALAREHAARGELVLALRAAWLASLAHLGQREFIRIARHKSNRDYERELRRRARDRAPLLDAFDDNRLAIERAWYGRHEVTAEHFAAFQRNLERIRES